jgi:hypothetical protein
LMMTSLQAETTKNAIITIRKILIVNPTFPISKVIIYNTPDEILWKTNVSVFQIHLLK